MMLTLLFQFRCKLFSRNLAENGTSILLSARKPFLSQVFITFASSVRRQQTRKHSSRMRTACFSDSGGVSLQRHSLDRHPLNKDPSRQRPLDRDPPKEHGTRDTHREPLERTWDQEARQEVISYRVTPTPTE